MAHAFLPLASGPHFRAGRFRSPQPDQIPEEPVRIDQPNPSQGPYPRSRWTGFDFQDIDKTIVCLNLSGPSPPTCGQRDTMTCPPHEPFFRAIPRNTLRLKSVFIRGAPENIQEATAQLFHRAPLLESLVIEANSEPPPMTLSYIPTTLFSRDLSSLCELHLQPICTELP